VLYQFDEIANGSRDIFLNYFEDLKRYVVNNPEILTANY